MLRAHPDAAAAGGDSSFLLAEAFASSAFFGVCYRYALRCDWDNTQIKSGAVGAFAVARGLGQADLLLGGGGLAGEGVSLGEALDRYGPDLVLAAKLDAIPVVYSPKWLRESGVGSLLEAEEAKNAPSAAGATGKPPYHGWSVVELERECMKRLTGWGQYIH